MVTLNTETQIALFINQPFFKDWPDFYNSLKQVLSDRFDGLGYPRAVSNESLVDIPRIVMSSQDGLYTMTIAPKIIRFVYTTPWDKEHEENYLDQLYKLMDYLNKEVKVKYERIGIIKTYFTALNGPSKYITSNFLNEKYKTIDDCEVKITKRSAYLDNMAINKHFTIGSGVLQRQGNNEEGLLIRYDLNNTNEDGIIFNKLEESKAFINWGLSENTSTNMHSELLINS